MEFEPEFDVDVPREQVYAALLDIPRVVTCLPGASEHDTHRVLVKPRIGPV